MLSPDLRARREVIVREHLESENAHEFDRTIATFEHPRYELIATGDVYDGEEAVRGYFAESRRAFPDQRNELIALHHADDAVIAEVEILGTHLGPPRALPPTGRSFRCRMSAHFLFQDDRLVCERTTSTSSRSCASSGLHMTQARSRDV
jgi:predicted ester cyclase